MLDARWKPVNDQTVAITDGRVQITYDADEGTLYLDKLEPGYDALDLPVGSYEVRAPGFHIEEPQNDFQDIELADGGVIEAPDDSGTIRRRDIHGNLEEVANPGDSNHAKLQSYFEGYEPPDDDRLRQELAARVYEAIEDRSISVSAEDIIGVVTVGSETYKYDPRTLRIADIGDFEGKPRWIPPVLLGEMRRGMNDKIEQRRLENEGITARVTPELRKQFPEIANLASVEFEIVNSALHWRGVNLSAPTMKI